MVLNGINVVCYQFCHISLLIIEGPTWSTVSSFAVGFEVEIDCPVFFKKTCISDELLFMLILIKLSFGLYALVAFTHSISLGLYIAAGNEHGYYKPVDNCRCFLNDWPSPFVTLCFINCQPQLSLILLLVMATAILNPAMDHKLHIQNTY